MKPSHPRLLRLPILLLMSLGLASLAQASDSTVPIEYLRPMKNSVSIGVRLIGGANVSFGGPGLGVISGINIHDPETRATLLNSLGYIPYEDGSVRSDSPDATTTTPSRPTQVGTPADANGRWQIPGTITGTNGVTIPVVKGDYLAYDSSGYSTRNWNASSQSQVPPNDDGTDSIEMSTYASNGVQDGQTANAKGNVRPGIELQFGRVIQRYKHFEWGFNFTFGISEFNAKNRQTLQANAIKYTDRYQVLNYAPNPSGNPNDPFVIVPGQLYRGPGTVNADGSPYVVTSGTLANPGTPGTPTITGPSFADLAYTDADGNSFDANGNPLVFSNGYETTAALGVGGDYAPQTVYDTNNIIGHDANGNPIYADYTPASGGVINGYWQVKGVYYLFRLGPMIRVPIGKHFSAAVSAGYIGAWVGSKMRFQEELVIPGITFPTRKYFTTYTYTPDGAGGFTATPVTDIVQNNRKFLSGAYVDANFEWWVTTRTGFYAGLVYEKLSGYTQRFSVPNSTVPTERIATVKMANGLGLHFGIITRF